MNVTGFKRNFLIDQGRILGCDQLFQGLYSRPLNDPKREGICTGLSMIWLSRLMMWHNETSDERKNALVTVSAFRWGGKTQDIHLNAGIGGQSIEEKFRHMYGEALRAYSLTIVPGSTVFYGDRDLAKLAANFAPHITSKRTYRLWNIGLKTPTGNAGHMVASYASGGKLGFNRHLYFFDPNMGEYKINLSETQSFVKAFLDAYATTFVGVNYISCMEVRYGN